MHISSLPSPYGIGTFGKEAYKFVDFLKESGQKCWQILPICPTSFGDSPYQSCSSYAGNPYFIDLDFLEEEGLLEKDEYSNIFWGGDTNTVDYGNLYDKRYVVLKKATKRFLKKIPDDYNSFIKKNKFWIDDFAVFMAIKDAYNGIAWNMWPKNLRNRDEEALKQAEIIYKDDIEFWKALQYIFFKQWYELKAYANKNGIEIIGDIPIYVSLDSVDVWKSPKLFQLDDNKDPIDVAGCPPDGFSADGQLWGNPLYNWDYMAEDDYSWWVSRINYLCNIYDVLRIDHFRGFDSYYAIPSGETTACNGRWKKGPGINLFKTVERKIGRKNIIAEDLGYMTESVKKLLEESGFPGMKVLEFAFDSRDSNNAEYFPDKYTSNCVAYTGTHDNDTVKGWFENALSDDVELAREYLKIKDNDEVNWKMMDAVWASRADLVIVQAQDILGLDQKSRMNIPSTVGGNWCWRVNAGAFTCETSLKLYNKMKKFGRM